MRLHQNSEHAVRPHRDEPIDANTFRMLVPKPGYRWIDDALPSTLFGAEKAEKLGCAPYMAVNASSQVSAQEYFPLLETPDLFCRFRNLNLDRESILAFANLHGWIGETGIVQDGTRSLVPAVGIGKWHEEIQAMIAAHHLWERVEKDERHILRNYFTWHVTEFDVRLEIGIQQREILAKNHPTLAEFPGGALPLKIDREWLIHPHQVELLRSIGWNRDDVLGPARLAVMNFINPRLAAYCHPRLYLDKHGRPVGHMTPVNLLGCIWLQFYLTVIGQLKLRLCTVCKLHMDVTESRSTKRMHDSCAKRERMRRWRTKQSGGPGGLSA